MSDHTNLENVAFYNLGAMEEIPGFGKNGLVRVPERVRKHLNERARFIGMDSVGIEARFVTDAPNIDLYITALQPEFGVRGSVRVYKGEFEVAGLELEPGRVCNFRLNPPQEFSRVKPTFVAGKGFSPDVWRVVFSRSSYVLHGINVHGHGIRKPEKSELPPINWLAYGSSITNSGIDGYEYIAAKSLGFQVQNMGFSGACFMAREIVDYMLDEREWDIISCELGINMISLFSAQDFEDRARYLIDRLIKIGKPTFLITSFPSMYSAESANPVDECTEHNMAYKAVLERLVQESGAPNLHLIRGEEILTDPNGLRFDLVHPTTYGHAVMGLNLAEKMRKILK